MADSSIDKNRIMKIGLDLDDTIIDHSNNIIALAQKYGLPGFSRDDLRAGRFSTLRNTLSENAYRELREELYGALSYNASPMAGSEEAIQRLDENGEKLYIISRRSAPRTAAFSWLKRQFPFIPEENIHFVNNDEDKGALCVSLHIDIFLDNKPEVLAYMPERTTPLLFDNLEIYKNNPPFRRVASWEEFLALWSELKALR